MDPRAGIQQGKSKPLDPKVAATILCVTAGLFLALGVAFWNGGDWFVRPMNQPSELPFYNLKLSRLILTQNVGGVFPRAVPLLSDGRPLENRLPETPVPYLPYVPDFPRIYRLSDNFMATLRAIAIAKLERGGLTFPEESVPDPNQPDLPPSTPEQKTDIPNGSLLFHIEATPDKKEKGTVVFSVSWELRRNLYLTRKSDRTTSHRMEGGVAGPFRVWEKHLESAIIYELEKMIAREIISRYQSSNQIGAKGQ